MLWLWIAVGVLCALIVAFGLFLFLIFPAVRRHPDRVLMRGRYIAHRGLHGVAVTRPDGSPDPRSGCPENSLPAFGLAADMGYAIENDIHVTRDGRVVVFHDDSLTRMCGVDARPEDLTLDELKALRLGGTDECIPTLEECLSVVGGRVPLLIEFKCTSKPVFRRLMAAAVPILDGYEGKYLVQSFFPLVAGWYKKNRPSVCRGVLARSFRGPGSKWYMRIAGCLLMNFFARPDFVSYMHEDAAHPCRRFCTRIGAYAVGWTFRSEEEVEKDGGWFETWIFEGFIPE